MPDYVLFSDDSGSSTRDKFYLNGGVLLTIESSIRLSAEIKKINFSHFGVKNEIKWSDIQVTLHQMRRGLDVGNEWLAQFGEKKLLEHIKTTLDLINQDYFQGCVVITVSDHYDEKMQSYQLQNLMQRMQYFLQPQKSFGLIIFDKRASTKGDNMLKDNYQFYLDNDRYANYDRILECLLTEDSNRSSAIQMSDYLVGVTAAALRQYKPSSQWFQNYVKPKLRKSSDGKIIGYGLMLVPSRNDDLMVLIKTRLNIT